MYEKNNNNYEDIEKLFNSEVRYKKVVARGVHNMASKRGIVKKMVTPLDFMSSKEKRQYTKGSEVKVSNVYDNIENVPSITELKERYKKDPNGMIAILKIIKEKHNAIELRKHWGYKSNSSVYTFFGNYGLKDNERVNRGEKIKAKVKEKKENKNTQLIQQQIQPQMQPQLSSMFPQTTTIIDVVEEEIFELKFNRQKDNGSNIINRITNLISILDENTEYEVKLKIVEKK